MKTAPAVCFAVLSVILTLALLPVSQAAEGKASDQPPNLVFIMADDLGYGHLGCYGQEKIKTPFIDQMAAEGLRFTNAYAGSAVCAPARSTLMSGLHTGHSPIRNNGAGNTIQDSDVTLAEVLKTRGYVTGGFGKWGLGNHDDPGAAIKQGFDEWVGQYSQVHAHFYYPWFLYHNAEKLLLPENEGLKTGTYAHDVIHEHAMAFIKEHGKSGQPFFAYLPYIIPHVELAVPEEDEVPYRTAGWPKYDLPDPRPGYIGSEDAYVTYAGMISRLDRHVGEVLQLIEELGIDEDTLVIFTSDNGAQGSAWRPLVEFFNGTGGLRDDKGSLHEGGIRVPMIARWPGKIAPGTETDLPTYFPDILPTFAEIAGVSPDQMPENVDGVSILPTLLGQPEKQKVHDYLYWEIGRGERLSQAVRHGKWKAYRKDQKSKWALYDLAADVGETTNLAAGHPDILKAITGWVARTRTEPREMPAGEKETWQDYKR